MERHINKNAFTLMEILTVIIIISIIAAFGLPNYHRSVERAHMTDAINNLVALHAAERVYRAEHGTWWPSGDNLAVAAINTALGLSIVENGMTYDCDGRVPPAGDWFTCTAVRDGSAFSVAVDENTIQLGDPTAGGANPSCSGSCPVLN